MLLIKEMPRRQENEVRIAEHNLESNRSWGIWRGNWRAFLETRSSTEFLQLFIAASEPGEILTVERIHRPGVG